MKRWIWTLFVVVALLVAPLQAQTAVSSNKLGWTQAAPTLADAQAYTYKYYPDGATTGIAFTGVVCSGAATPFSCEVPFPAFTPGNHTLQITAQNVAGESGKSSPLSFTFVVVPAVPTGLIIK
jgi:hypothetical protein